MARIKIKDLPKNQKISQADMRKIMGGFNPQPEPPGRFLVYGGGASNPSLFNSGITQGIFIQY